MGEDWEEREGEEGGRERDWAERERVGGRERGGESERERERGIEMESERRRQWFTSARETSEVCQLFLNVMRTVKNMERSRTLDRLRNCQHAMIDITQEKHIDFSVAVHSRCERSSINLDML